MTDLASVQSWMQGALLHPAGLEDADRLVAPGANLSAAECIGIYQRSYALRLLACMRAAFPALTHALGAELFNDFAVEYLRECPAETWTLHELGRRFPAYLEQTRPEPEAPEAWVDFMIDLATFERQIFVIFEVLGLEGAPYADESTPDGALRLQPCFELASYRFPVAKYYYGVQADADPPIPAPAGTWLALTRRDYIVRTISVTPMQYTFLAAMQAGARVDDALAHVAAARDVAVDDIRIAWSADGGPRTQWLAAGMFAPAP